MSSLKRPFAELEWTPNGPVAVATGDVYFSIENGLDETRSVFLQGAGFPDRFGDDLTIVGELGFGTGLNFLALWQSFLENAKPNARLHFVSVEGFPLTRDDAQRALSAFPEIEPFAKALTAAWPSPHNGPHRRVFEKGRVTLTVFHNDVEAALPQMDFQADAWFLDGFAPAKNPQMWADTLYDEIARLSKPGALAASFTVAGHVRRGLASAGFEVSKQPGFGRKRERLEAIYRGTAHTPKPSPFAPPDALDGPIAIIGGGIAAASLVEALSRRSRDIRVFAEGGWARGASSAPKGLLTARLGLQDSPKQRAFLAAFDYATHLYASTGAFEQTGIFTLSDSEGLDRAKRLADRLDDGFVFQNAKLASHRTGEPVLGGLWQARAGAFNPKGLIAAIHGGHSARDCAIAAIESSDDGVILMDRQGARVFEGAAVIYAGGAYGTKLIDAAFKTRPVAGRVGVFETSAPPTAPVDGFGYLAPFQDGIVLGSTHIHDHDPGTAQSAESELRETLGEALPVLAQTLGAQTQSWAGVRCSTLDHDPVSGVLPASDYSSVWQALAKGRSGTEPIQSACDRRVLALTGLGGRGFTHAPLLAESLVSRLCGEPDLLQADSLQALHPARFVWRGLKRS